MCLLVMNVQEHLVGMSRREVSAVCLLVNVEETCCLAAVRVVGVAPPMQADRTHCLGSCIWHDADNTKSMHQDSATFTARTQLYCISDTTCKTCSMKHW